MRRLALTVALAALAAAAPVAADPAPAAGIERITASGGAGSVDLSPDARFVAFASTAADLVADDTNGVSDVFVHDRATGAVERVSVDSGEHEVAKASSQPSISADGRFVAFASLGALVPEDTNGAWDVYLRDRLTGATERVSASRTGGNGSGASHAPSLSDDGMLVAFHSTSENLAAGDGNNRSDVFVRDRGAGVTTLVSTGVGGAPSSGNSTNASLGGDGTVVVFTSTASNLVAGDGNGWSDVFAHDLASGETTRVSVGTGEAHEVSESGENAVSADGTVVAFTSRAANLVPTDSNARLDVFVRDLASGRTERVSLTSAGGEHDGGDGLDRPADHVSDVQVQPRPAISHDGQTVAFLSAAPNLSGGSDVVQLLLHDRESGITHVASAPPGSASGGGPSQAGALSRDGTVVAFSSAAALVPGGSGGETDVYVRERPRVGAYAVAAERGDEGLRVSGEVAFTAAVPVAETDAGDDASGGTPLGGELLAASVLHRPERGDLLVRWRPTALPSVAAPASLRAQNASGGSLPSQVASTVAYDLRFTVAAGSYRARVTGTGATLLHCETVCTRIGTLEGGFGTAGVEARVALPLTLLGNPDRLTAVVAAALTSDTPAAGVWDEVALRDVDLPAPRVDARPLGASDDSWVEATVDAGRFSVLLPDGAEAVQVRACAGARCHVRDVAVPAPAG